MSTNYYAVIERGTEFDSALSTRYIYHIGKTTNRSVSLNGTYHASWQAWKAMFEVMAPVIQAESGFTVEIDEFIKFIEDGFTPEDRGRQFEWEQKYDPTSSRTWLDHEGFSMSEGDWS